MLKILRYLAIPIFAATIGCSAPQNKFSSVETLRDNRNFSNVNVYGKCESDLGKMFGQFEMKSSTKYPDLSTFNSRIRLVRPIVSDFGITSEYRDFSGNENGVIGLGISCSPIKSVELRAYPIRTDKTEEAGISFGKVFEAGDIDPYVRGFVDVNRNGSELRSTGKFQVGFKTKEGWRLGAEIRYSDSDRKNKIGNPGCAFGIGIDF